MIIRTVDHYTVVGVAIADDDERRIAGLYDDEETPLFACIMVPTAAHCDDTERMTPITVLSTEQLAIGSHYRHGLVPVGIERVIAPADPVLA